MHICFVCREYVPSLRGGGIASYVKEMAEYMSLNNHKVTVICASDDTRKEYSYMENGVNIIRLSGGDFIIPQVEKKSLINRFRIFYRFFSYRKKILQTIRSIKDIDIIEVPDYGAESYYLKTLKIPIIIRLHASTLILNELISGEKGITKSNWYIYWQGIQEFKEIKRAQYITSCSQAMKEIVVQRLSLLPDKIKVIFNPIKIDNEISNNIVPKKLNKNKIRILLPGAVYNLKGGEDLIKACIQLTTTSNKKIELYLIGKKGKFANYLENKYATYKWIHLPGPIPRDEIMKQYIQADIICLPSWWENMPMTCIEAMLCGCLVIGSNSGGIKEIIKDGENGFLVPAKSPQLLAKKIEYVLNLNEKQINQIRINAYNTILQNFNIDIITSKTIQYYKHVIQNYHNQNNTYNK